MADLSQSSDLQQSKPSELSSRSTNKIKPNSNEALRKRDQLLQLFIDQLDDFAIAVLDAHGRVVSWSAGAEQLYGYRDSEIIGSHVACLDRAVDTLANKARQDLCEAAKSGRMAFEAPRVRKDGGEFWASLVIAPLRNDEGKLRGYTIITRDITDQRRTDDGLRVMAELSINAIVLVNMSGKIVSVNAQTEKMFGYQREALIGQSVEILVPDRYKSGHPASRERYFGSPVVRLMGAGRDLYGRRSDGTEFPVEIGLNPIKTSDESFVLSAIVDITARRTAEDRARKYLNDLAHVARLSTVGQMFSELAHELNQPLAAAANYARACIRFAQSNQGLPPQQLIALMEKTVSQTTRALEIVKRLSAFMKKDGGARTMVNANRLIERVVSLSVPVMQAASANYEPVRLELTLDESLPTIVADAVQIEQVLLNLVRNAIEAMQDSSVPKKLLSIRTCYDERTIQVEVSDTGPGIKPEHVEQLFSAYFTTKSNGVGLGLSISRSIIEDHEGRMEVQTSDAGSTFRFYLPIATTGHIL